jgi:type II secretion system protein F
MPTYIYKAKTGPDKIIEGSMTADSQNAVILKLGEQGYYPISIKEATKGKSGIVISRARVSQKDIGMFTRQLADLLEGGLTLYQALDTLSKQTANKTFSKIIEEIRDKVREGNPLSDSMSNYPKVFTPIYISMVRSGETGGMIDSVLVRLAEFSDKEQELRSRVKSALMYPLFLGAFGILTVSVLLIFVVPRLTSIFDDFGQDLPLPTKVLIGISHFMGAWWWLIVMIVVLTVFVVFQQEKSKEGKFILDKLRLRVPVLGKLRLMGELARFSRTLAALFESGVPVLKSLEIVSDTMTNEVVKRELIKVHEKISKGGSLGASLEESFCFPLFMINMIKVGEKGGLLEKSLLKIAEAYDREVNRFTSMFTALLEPIMIVTMGLSIGFIVVSMLLPIFNINLAVK